MSFENALRHEFEVELVRNVRSMKRAANEPAQPAPQASPPSNRQHALARTRFCCGCANLKPECCFTMNLSSQALKLACFCTGTGSGRTCPRAGADSDRQQGATVVAAHGTEAGPT